MTVGNWTTSAKFKVESEILQECEEFCYLGSTISDDGGCVREIIIRLGKANSVFGRLRRIWASKKISVRVKVRKYESLILSVLLGWAETWPMQQITTKNMEAAHPRWLRVVHVSWKDKVTMRR